MPTVLLAHPGYSSGGPYEAILEKAGFSLRKKPEGSDFFNEEQFREALQGCEAVIAATEPYSRSLMEQTPDLRVIARSGVGYDAVDVSAADVHDIVVTTTPGTNEHSVAEHALAMMMAIARGFPERDRQVRRGPPWTRRAGPRMAGKKLGIMGLGRIGQALATRAIGLGMQVIAFEPYPNEAFIQQWKIKRVTLQELLTESDFVSVHVPLCEATHGVINRETMNQMKKGSMLVNTSRGGIVIEEDLVEILKNGPLAAAALDVFDTEPLPLNSPLLAVDNLLLSPHLAGLDEQSAYDASVMVAESIVALFEGKWPSECVVNDQLDSTWRWNRSDS
ncbi:MAG: phosphoglycerate dehydrogenase [Planctomycetota bacterium]|nr:phosphoglycerate dehydrogenase [Planctomycetota bacterium]